MKYPKNFGQWSTLLIAGVAMCLIGCVKNSGNSASGEAYNVTESSSFVVGPIVHDPLIYPTRAPRFCWPKKDKCYTDGYTVESSGTGKVDLLFVVQTSNSIAPQRSQIASEIQDFVQSLPSSADFNIAVMLSHGSTSSYSGRLYRAGSEPVVLKSKEISNQAMQGYLADKLTRVVSDAASGGGEEGMFSLFNGITTPTSLAESQSYGFFRSEAALAVVFIADRRDICAVIPAGVPAETDPVKIEARIRDCEGLTAAGLTSRLKALKGNQELEVSGIVYAAVPTPAGKELSYGIMEMIARNPGVAIDIQNDDISYGMSAIAAMAGNDGFAQTQFQLTHDNVKAESVKVRVNGRTANFRLEGNVVIITSPISGGDQVMIDYCVKKEKLFKWRRK